MTEVNELFYCTIQWNDTKEIVYGVCISTGEWNGKEDYRDERIFYYTDGQPIIGDHGDFTVLEAE